MEETPAKVRLNFVPIWLGARITALAKREPEVKLETQRRSRFIKVLWLSRVVDRGLDTPHPGAWLDHFGESTNEHGESVFVTEPYHFDPTSIKRFCELLDLDYLIREPSSWGRGTVRIEFKPSKSEERVKESQ